MFYKDYILSRKYTFKDVKTDRYVTSVQVQTIDKKTINEKILDVPSVVFNGTIGSYAYGTSSGDDNSVFIINVPTWEIVYALKLEDYARIIGDDGNKVLIWKGENIIAVKPEDGT